MESNLIRRYIFLVSVIIVILLAQIIFPILAKNIAVDLISDFAT